MPFRDPTSPVRPGASWAPVLTLGTPAPRLARSLRDARGNHVVRASPARLHGGDQVARQLLDLVLRHVAVAAKHLDGVLADLVGGARGARPRSRRRRAMRAAVVVAATVVTTTRATTTTTVNCKFYAL